MAISVGTQNFMNDTDQRSLIKVWEPISFGGSFKNEQTEVFRSKIAAWHSNLSPLGA